MLPRAFVTLAFAVLVFAGCAQPGPPDGWTESRIQGGPQLQPNGTFQFVDVWGTVLETGVELPHTDCDMEPPSADVDVEGRRLVLPEALLRQWAPNVTLVVRDRVFDQGEGSSCNVPRLHARDTLSFHPDEATMGLTMSILALDTGPAIGAYRVLEEGVPYRHRVSWEEADPAYGGLRHFVLDIEFLYRGLWSWDDAEAGEGTTTWA